MDKYYSEMVHNSKIGEPVFMKVKGKQLLIGTVYERVFYKTLNKSRHFLRLPRPSVAIDIGIFDNYIREDCDSIVLIERENKDIYRTTTNLFIKNNFPYESKGWGKQYALPMMWWMKYGDK